MDGRARTEDIVATKRLGERILEARLITPQQLEMALAEQQRTRERLGTTLVRLGFVSAQDLAKALAQEYQIPYVSLLSADVDRTLLARVDKDFIIKHLAVPIQVVGDQLYVAMADPYDVEVMDLIYERFGYYVEPIWSTEQEITEYAEQHFTAQGVVESPVDNTVQQVVEDLRRGKEVREGLVANLVNQVIREAIKAGATDIHVEPEERLLRIRLRVDGVLSTAFLLPKDVEAPVTSRIKIISRLDIAERRLPQDGRVQFRDGSTDLDIRVSLIPTDFGENTVMRLLNKSGAIPSLEGLGFPQHVLEPFKRLVKSPHGVFLVTGPTGSGKSTTLYTGLREVDAMAMKVATIEDPIEYRMPLVRQSQVLPAVGFDFASGLRALLRQDPDVILVGEIRDLETAEIAVRASMTGHLVLSSLHTNSAIGAFPRLIDMGIDPFLINSSLIAVQAQRLVRRVCTACEFVKESSNEEMQWLGLDPSRDARIPMHRGQGCAKCLQTGYKGRTGIYELAEPTDDLRAGVLRKESEAALTAIARKSGFRSMREDGVSKVRQGLTTIEEILRVLKD
ncbi:MAG: Flp pilus assembly complex ATPase component TadA [Planctomycetes bacterium]|nr:Flp pilus assembly complex ATPase component TadA [Planctomycetota bacterium]